MSNLNHDKIDQLLAQAGCRFVWLNEYNLDNFDPYHFSRLIINECCQKLENDGMVEVAMELKQYFGVE